MIDCWNAIGVRGDRSCPELPQYVHCRNCPVYSAGAVRVLDRDAPAGYLVQQTGHFAQAKTVAEQATQAVVIFRIGAEWLALPAACVKEVAELLPIHSLPHRPGGVILGVASVRGELLICMSLARVLGLDERGVDPRRGLVAAGRLLVLESDQRRAVCRVDEVHGVHRTRPQDIQEVPATVARAAATYTKGLLVWGDHRVGLIEAELVFHTLQRSAA